MYNKYKIHNYKKHFFVKITITVLAKHNHVKA